MSDASDLVDRQRREFDDLQNEIAGREVGRRARFLTQNDGRSIEDRRRKRMDQAFQSALDMLLLDPVYRARYEAAQNALGRAERATETVLERLASQIDAAEVSLQNLRDRAARLPDGTIVFRDQTGAVRREDGSQVSNTLAATILWTGNEPSYEEFVQSSARLNDLRQDLAEVETYQTDVLGDARHQLDDEENPLDLDELDAIIDGVESQMPDAVREELSSVPEGQPPIAVSADMVPDLSP